MKQKIKSIAAIERKLYLLTERGDLLEMSLKGAKWVVREIPIVIEATDENA